MVSGRMPGWRLDDDAARARRREFVRRGYDAISLTYRNDDGEAAQASAEDVSRYAEWVVGLAVLLPVSPWPEL